MRRTRIYSIGTIACCALLSVWGMPLSAQTQDTAGQVSTQSQEQQEQTTTPSTGWRKVGGPPTAAEEKNPADGGTDMATASVSGQDMGNGVHVYDPNPQGNQQPMNGPMNAPPAATATPAQLTIQPGMYLTVRVNQELSSSKNHVGDPFTATLEQPLVVNGIVVASPGQLVSGRVTEVEKSGRIEGVARLGVQLTDLTLVDGQQVPIQSQFISQVAPGSKGRDAGVIAGTTALGAAIGAAAGWGAGAAIGAGAGAAASTIGVLITRGHASVIGPEEVLTFRITSPITISTVSAPEAFRPVDPREYGYYSQQSQQQTIRYQQAEHPPVVYQPYPWPYAYPYASWTAFGYPYYGWGYPYWGGVGLNFIYLGGHYYPRGGWHGPVAHGYAGGFHGGRR